MEEELISVINKMIQAINVLTEKIDDNATNISDINKYFNNLGDLGQLMQNVLTDTLEKHDVVNMLVADTFKKSSEFIKETNSVRYPYQNLMQEWFSDLMVVVYMEYTGRSRKHIEEWTRLQFREFIHNNMDRLPSTLTYEARVNFGESLFKKGMVDLGLTSKGFFICRTLYIPYISMYYLRPMSDYPHFEEWTADLEYYRKEDKNIK